jgi:hypothetical protein
VLTLKFKNQNSKFKIIFLTFDTGYVKARKAGNARKEVSSRKFLEPLPTGRQARILKPCC